jgi:hypothetical protein
VTAENAVDVPTGGVDDTDLHCALCDTDLEPGMDTIMRLEEFPGVVFCDRCQPLMSLGLRTVDDAAAPKLRDRTRTPWTLAHSLILAGLVTIAATAVGVAIIAGTFLAGLITRN